MFSLPLFLFLITLFVSSPHGSTWQPSSCCFLLLLCVAAPTQAGTFMPVVKTSLGLVIKIQCHSLYDEILFYQLFSLQQWPFVFFMTSLPFPFLSRFLKFISPVKSWQQNGGVAAQYQKSLAPSYMCSSTYSTWFGCTCLSQIPLVQLCVLLLWCHHDIDFQIILKWLWTAQSPK